MKLINKLIPVIGASAVAAAISPFVFSCNKVEPIILNAMNEFSTTGWQKYKLPEGKDSITASKAQEEYWKANKADKNVILNDILWGADCMKDYQETSGYEKIKFTDLQVKIFDFNCTENDFYKNLYSMKLEIHIAFDISDTSDVKISSYDINASIETKLFPLTFEYLYTVDCWAAEIIPLLGVDALEFLNFNKNSSYDMNITVANLTFDPDTKEMKVRQEKTLNCCQNYEHPDMEMYGEMIMSYEDWLFISQNLTFPMYYFSETTIIQ